MTLSVTTENESAATESGATDVSRSRDSSVLTHCRQSRTGTDEPSAHPWHQIAIGACMLGMHFQVKAVGMKHLLLGVRRRCGRASPLRRVAQRGALLAFSGAQELTLGDFSCGRAGYGNDPKPNLDRYNQWSWEVMGEHCRQHVSGDGAGLGT